LVFVEESSLVSAYLAVKQRISSILSKKNSAEVYFSRAFQTTVLIRLCARVFIYLLGNLEGKHGGFTSSGCVLFLTSSLLHPLHAATRS